MDKRVLIALGLYLCGMSLVSVVLTLVDKRNAQMHRFRVPERTLLLSAVLGGSLAEYLVMKLIRHKTQHKKFMIGLPLIMVLQLCAVAAAIYFLYFRPS